MDYSLSTATLVDPSLINLFLLRQPVKSELKGLLRLVVSDPGLSICPIICLVWACAQLSSLCIYQPIHFSLLPCLAQLFCLIMHCLNKSPAGWLQENTISSWLALSSSGISMCVERSGACSQSSEWRRTSQSSDVTVEDSLRGWRCVRDQIQEVWTVCLQDVRGSVSLHLSGRCFFMVKHAYMFVFAYSTCDNCGCSCASVS